MVIKNFHNVGKGCKNGGNDEFQNRLRNGDNTKDDTNFGGENENFRNCEGHRYAFFNLTNKKLKVKDIPLLFLIKAVKSM